MREEREEIVPSLVFFVKNTKGEFEEVHQIFNALAIPREDEFVISYEEEKTILSGRVLRVEHVFEERATRSGHWVNLYIEPDSECPNLFPSDVVDE